ncbi:MAG: hypothetical protein BSOLF_1757 [Candidatus Carbobacillus altaicus]|uniref:Uncharacterized protein n=1 Tax=Candidatus Carbonibacillus altaicus TaxID=2163959 RepID=A0A2R6XYX9_9BACL|nr:MAG: hypothetical protein BSOLF_1757 [Candidatus Carbobacillus altaicus]
MSSPSFGTFRTYISATVSRINDNHIFRLNWNYRTSRFIDIIAYIKLCGAIVPLPEKKMIRGNNQQSE